MIEFKLNKSAEEALKQIENKKYYLPYQTKGKPIILIGVNIKKETRTIDSWVSKEISSIISIDM